MNIHTLPFRTMMILAPLTLAIGCVLAWTVPSYSQTVDFGNLTGQQRAALHDEFRRFLTENPEVVVDALTEFERRERQAQLELGRTIVAENRDRLFADENSWTGGNPNGDITVVEFLDYRCGFCRRSHPVLQQLLETDPNVRLVLKEFPVLGPESVFAASLAISVLKLAGPEAYKKVHDLLITYEHAYDSAVIVQVAALTELDARLIEETMIANSTAEVIAENYRLASDLQFNATPSFVIEGQPALGYLSLAEMRDRIRQERARRQ